MKEVDTTVNCNVYEYVKHLQKYGFIRNGYDLQILFLIISSLAFTVKLEFMKNKQNRLYIYIIRI